MWSGLYPGEKIIGDLIFDIGDGEEAGKGRTIFLLFVFYRGDVTDGAQGVVFGFIAD